MFFSQCLHHIILHNIKLKYTPLTLSPLKQYNKTTSNALSLSKNLSNVKFLKVKTQQWAHFYADILDWRVSGAAQSAEQT